VGYWNIEIRNIGAAIRKEGATGRQRIQSSFIRRKALPGTQAGVAMEVVVTAEFFLCFV